MNKLSTESLPTELRFRGRHVIKEKHIKINLGRQNREARAFA